VASIGAGGNGTALGVTRLRYCTGDGITSATIATGAGWYIGPTVCPIGRMIGAFGADVDGMQLGCIRVRRRS